MHLRDTYTEMDFKNLGARRKVGTGHGPRKHNVNIRPLGGFEQSPRAAKPKGSAFD